MSEICNKEYLKELKDKLTTIIDNHSYKFYDKSEHDSIKMWLDDINASEKEAGRHGVFIIDKFDPNSTDLNIHLVVPDEFKSEYEGL